MKQLITQIISDVDGQGSSKRIVLFGLLGLIAILAVGVTFFKAHFEAVIWEDLFFALLTFGGMVTAEKFTKRSVRNDQTTQP